MNRFISIPREALAELLKASGSPLTPEDYLATLPPDFDPYKKFPGRAVAAIFSKYFLLVAAVISGGLTCTSLGFGFEGILVTVILAVITFFEFRVHRAFRECRPEAPSLGFRNQCGFAVFILIYCLYHAFAPLEIPEHYREYAVPDLGSLPRILVMVTYLTIGIVGGLSQFGLAWYYRSARIAA